MGPRRRRAALLAAVIGLVPAEAWGGLPPIIEGVERIDRALLRGVPGPISARVHALGATIQVDAPRGAAALARALRLSPLTLCPDLEQRAAGVTLRCRSRRIVARLHEKDGLHVLEVSETRGLPWDGDDGPPLVSLDDAAAATRTYAGRAPTRTAERLLHAGDRAGARAALRDVTGAAADGLPALRLGDLALADGDVVAATSHWARVRGRPWEHLAAARLCELSWTCLAESTLEALYAVEGFPARAAGDLALRHARALAFLGRGAQAVARVVRSEPALTACAEARPLCRDIASAGLAAAGPEALDALALWLTIPEDGGDPSPYEAAVAAATVAEREGAPLFAAQLLASNVGQVPARALREHLLRTAELFVAGGDPVRAGVVVEFARAHAPERSLAGARWAAVTRSVQRGLPSPRPLPAAERELTIRPSPSAPAREGRRP